MKTNCGPCGPESIKGSAKSGQVLIAGLVVVIILSVVVIGSVLHSWKSQFKDWKQCSRGTEVENLQAQINSLKKEVAKNKLYALGKAANQNQPAASVSSSAFEAAVNGKDFTEVESLMAARVNYVVDSSDCCGDITKKEAAANLKKYIAGAKSFNFNQDQQVVKQMKVNLADTFAKYTIGIADNKMVLSYHLDSQGKVDDLMLSASHLMYDLE